MAVTGDHLILSLAEVQEKQGPREIWMLHRNIQAIGKGEESGGRSGTITLRFVIGRVTVKRKVGPGGSKILYSTNSGPKYPIFGVLKAYAPKSAGGWGGH